ncbi:hypothetical protein [Nocardioides sp. InS609-2]|uniref:hypothetical protein n=1 Tax=Nocardioides sp. InS609-2 TaxID=2760705 RepID=UPI0020BF4310|nr:hypothetical protein [Nocardioides sp. InS609-2]
MKRVPAALTATVGLILGIVLAGALSPAQSDAPAAASACAYPTGSISNAKLLAYMRCRFDEQAGTSTPVPSPSATPAPSPTPSPSPTTSPTPTPASGFPDASNTGTPDEQTLTTYTGPATINTAGTVIDGKITGDLTINAANVTIRNSRVNGVVVMSESGTATVTILDSTINGGTATIGVVGQRNITMRRTEVIGGAHSISCKANCDIQDSWLHAQYMPSSQAVHGDGFLSNGGDNMRVVHNTLACDSRPNNAGGACSSGVALYGDFDPITNVTIDGNYFPESPAGYCLYGAWDGKPYGPQTRNLVITNNVFARGASGKCGVYGPVAAIAPSTNGNVFTGNRWDDGAALNP